MTNSELQIVLNILEVFVLPPLAGIILRAIFLKKQKGFLVSAVLGVLTAGAAVWAFAIPSHGDETPGIIFCMAGLATVGALLCGGVNRLVRKLKSK